MHLSAAAVSRWARRGGPPAARRTLGQLATARRPPGFQPNEYGLQWFSSKDRVLSVEPEGALLVSAPYEFDATRHQARKYAAVGSHYDYWELIESCREQGHMHALHEVLQENQPRSLYFDLDGPVSFAPAHQEIASLLQAFVRWAFCGDELGWSDRDPEPVVLRSSDPNKYSCHVIFPQIQFESFEQQGKFLQVILPALPALSLEHDDGQSLPLLERIVDRVPYMRFQLFRGPYACKLADGALRRDTQLLPEALFRGDDLCCFAGYTEEGHMLPLASPERMLQMNKELRRHHEQYQQRGPHGLSTDGPWPTSPQDLANLYTPAFRQDTRGHLNFAGLSDVEKFEEGLRWLHPDRAHQWWSWFRLCGVTFTMLERHSADLALRRRIWQAHHAWAGAFPRYCAEENDRMVLKSEGHRVSGLGLLMRLVNHDNPGMRFRSQLFARNEQHNGADRAAGTPRSVASP